MPAGEAAAATIIVSKRARPLAFSHNANTGGGSSGGDDDDDAVCEDADGGRGDQAVSDCVTMPLRKATIFGPRTRNTARCGRRANACVADAHSGRDGDDDDDDGDDGDDDTDVLDGDDCRNDDVEMDAATRGDATLHIAAGIALTDVVVVNVVDVIVDIVVVDVVIVAVLKR
jgi:hypothetical protein